MADGYLPALTTSFTRNDVKISITDFADKQTIVGSPVELMYTRVSVTNEGSADVTVPAGQSGPNLVTLGSAPDTVSRRRDRAPRLRRRRRHIRVRRFAAGRR